MLLLPQQVLMTWNGTTKKHFVPKGYAYTKSGDTFLVNVLELPKGSNKKVKVICDYCEKVYEKIYNSYNTWKKKSIVKKDACQKCLGLKNKDVLLEKYGVSHSTKLPNVVEKIKNSQKFSQEFVSKKFEERGYILIGEYINNKTKLEYICPKHGLKTISYASFSKGSGCKECGYESFSGENHYAWNGGTKPLRDHLRINVISQWKKDSMKNCNYRCVITGDRFDDIHHLYNFQNIIFETLEILGLEVKHNLGDYSEEELSNINNLFLESHYKYGLGVCLRKDIHKLFHQLYGKSNNTPEQFEEFKTRYFNKEFNHLLNKKVVSL